MIKAWIGTLVAAAVLAPDVAAQEPDCFPTKSSNEARVMAKFDVPLAFSAIAAPARPPAGRIELGLELSYVPKIDPALGLPTECRPEKLRPENTDLVPLVPRPRVAVRLPWGFGVEASWIPPLRISEAKANLVSVAVSRVTAIGHGGVLVGLRVHGTFGVINGPITCDDAAIQDATSICYQGQRSDDAFHPNVYGIEGTVGWRLGKSLRPYMGGGYNRLAPRFRVNFTDQFDQTDRRRVGVDLDRGVLFAGATWRATPAVELSGEVYSPPTDAVTVRVAARVLLGKRGAGD
ncbi:MAG TPA: hypothetical protein VGP87_04135 [Gemmatimonadales bacterium]|nr:hypothetical protein [Gemmatimonadales bacterium]